MSYATVGVAVVFYATGLLLGIWLGWDAGLQAGIDKGLTMFSVHRASEETKR
jgi:hypothetical protein